MKTDALPYSKYYRILNIPVGSTKKEVKRAFRRKAMLTHPDRNPNPNAKAQFLEVNTAYEILTGQRALPNRKPAHPGANRPSKTNTQSTYSKTATDRETRREKMKEARRKKEEAYRNSPQFKKDLAIGIILDQIGYILAALLLFTIPFILYANPTVGFVLVMLVLALSSPLWFKALFTTQKTMNLKHLRLALKYVYGNTHFRYYIFTALNITAILVFIFNTFIFFSLVLFLMALPTLFLVARQELFNKKIEKEQWFKASSLGPLLVNLFFVINFTFSHTTQDEYYAVSPSYNQSSNFFISFKQEDYKHYPSVRFFMTYKTDYFPYVWLKTETGLFGIRVLKHYTFVRYPGEQSSFD